MTNNEYLTVINALVDRVAYLEEYADDLKVRAEDAEADFAQADEELALIKAKLDGQITGSAREQADTEKRIDSMMQKIKQLQLDLEAREAALRELGETFKAYKDHTNKLIENYQDEIRMLKVYIDSRRNFIQTNNHELYDYLRPELYEQFYEMFDLTRPGDELPPFEIPDEFFGDEEDEDNGD